MIAPHGVVIEAVGATCAVGRGIAQIAASVQAGISRVAQSPVHDGVLDPVTMARFPEKDLPPLAHDLDGLGLTSRQRRMLRLAGAPLREVLASLPKATPPLPLYLGLPEPRGERVPARNLVAHLTAQAGTTVDDRNSQVFPRGRAAGLMALQAAMADLGKGRWEKVLVGGVDTFLDLALLTELDREGRLLSSRVTDGFVPGEGAAFALLGTRRSRRSPSPTSQVQVLGIGSAQDPGHRYSDKPAKGEGLALALDTLFKSIPVPPVPIASVFAGFNGEHFSAKEWGVAQIRHSDQMARPVRMSHPADCYGDLGAATGPMLLALACATLSRGLAPGPALVFASSDREDRACALLDLLS